MIGWIILSILVGALVIVSLYSLTRPLKTPEEEHDEMVRRVGRFWR